MTSTDYRHGPEGFRFVISCFADRVLIGQDRQDRQEDSRVRLGQDGDRVLLVGRVLCGRRGLDGRRSTDDRQGADGVRFVVLTFWAGQDVAGSEDADVAENGGFYAQMDRLRHVQSGCTAETRRRWGGIGVGIGPDQNAKARKGEDAKEAWVLGIRCTAGTATQNPQITTHNLTIPTDTGAIHAWACWKPIGGIEGSGHFGPAPCNGRDGREARRGCRTAARRSQRVRFSLAAG